MIERPIVIDVDRHLIAKGDKRCRLTHREMLLVTYLAAHPGFVRSRNQIMDHVYGVDYYINDRSIDCLVKRTRRTVFAALGECPIGTQHGAGYFWRETP